VTTAGAAHCWGSNVFGRLGNGTDTKSSVPVAVAGGRTFASVSTRGSYNCGVTTGGAAFCWGENNWGQLGDGTSTNSSVPVAVSLP
jgi:alpha-tubulin suppressor-like RCC1 family protein